MAASTTLLKLATAFSVLLFVGLGVYLAPLKPSVVALQFTFSPAAFTQVLQTWGPEGVQRFRNHLPIDGLLLLSYSAAGYGAVTRTRFFESLTPWLSLRWVALVMPFVAVCDAGEDWLHWMLTSAELLSSTGSATPEWYLLAGVCASLKWLGIAGFSALALMTRLTRS